MSVFLGPISVRRVKRFTYVTQALSRHSLLMAPPPSMTLKCRQFRSQVAAYPVIVFSRRWLSRKDPLSGLIWLLGTYVPAYATLQLQVLIPFMFTYGALLKVVAFGVYCPFGALAFHERSSIQVQN